MHLLQLLWRGVKVVGQSALQSVDVHSITMRRIIPKTLKLMVTVVLFADQPRSNKEGETKLKFNQS